MLFKHLRMAALAATLLAGSAGLALAQTQTGPTADAPAAGVTENGNETDYGWLGLLGLIGLAGLWRRREPHAQTRAYADTSERTRETTAGR